MEIFSVPLLFLLPPFILGVSGGLCAKRLISAVLTGFLVGLLTTVIVASLFWVVDGETLLRFLACLILASLLGSLFAYKSRPLLSERRSRQLAAVLCILGAIVFAGVFLPPLQESHELVRRPTCLGNLKQIGLALEIYADKSRSVAARKWGQGSRLPAANWHARQNEWTEHISLPKGCGSPRCADW
jgi:peptidoglycan/LPS O-acetylase OafA/YrhL